MADIETDLFGEPLAPRRPQGRPRHSPTPELRAQVAALRRAGVIQTVIAAVIGIAPPTLVLHYSCELQSKSNAWRRHAGANNRKEKSVPKTPPNDSIVPLDNMTPELWEQSAVVQAEVLEVLKRLVRDGFDYRTVLSGGSTAIAAMVQGILGADQIPIHFARMAAITMHKAKPD